MKIRIKKSVFWKNYVVKYIYEKSVNRKLWRKSIMKKIMFGNSLMLLGIAIMILAGLELIYIGIMWASFLLIPVGFIMAVIGFFSKDS
jgi:small-conductance mechanosensitive channel